MTRQDWDILGNFLLTLAFFMAFVVLGLVIGLHAGVFRSPEATKPNELVCLNGRQYISYQAPEKGLGMVVTRREGALAVARCGEGTPEDVAEASGRMLRRLDEIAAMEDK